MYKLLIACASLAVAAASPGYLGAPLAAHGYLGAPLATYAHGPVIGAPLAAPYIGAPVVKTALPYSPYIGAPVVKTALPYATSYANTYKVSAPLAYAAHGPVVAPAPLLAHGW